MKTLDAKLAAIHADPSGAPDFILADARDADMAFGLDTPGTDPSTGRRRSLAEFREQVREVVRQGLVDVMLMSASTNDLLTREGLFAGSKVTAAVRANDSTDIHALAGATYTRQPSRPLRTPRIDEVMRGGTDLALYSITPLGDSERDAAALEAYRDFRAEAERGGLRHFLEVFPPNVPAPVADVGRFLSDFVVRALAGVPASGRPVFLKLPYTGQRSMEELVHYDPHLVVGVLGGSAGTTADAFHLIEEARRHGARAAIFGRKIKQSEHQLTFVRHLRAIADGELRAADACRSYHSDLERLGVRPQRPLSEDLRITDKGLLAAV
jgi:DhnA family fructose-bisphosphate aldolase class Ia